MFKKCASKTNRILRKPLTMLKRYRNSWFKRYLLLLWTSGIRELMCFLRRRRREYLTSFIYSSLANVILFYIYLVFAMPGELPHCFFLSNGVIYHGRECAGTGRQARLRGVCLWRTGSSPVTRTRFVFYLVWSPLS